MLWIDREQSEDKREEIKKLSKELEINDLVVEVLYNRGLNKEEIKDFVNTTFWHNPFDLKDMSKVVKRVNQAIEDKERIIIYGDYDCDGITSTALLLEVLNDLGADVGYYIPNRLDEGYGMNKEAIRTISGYADLIITVDCGIKAFEEVGYANKQDIDVIITDHHTADKQVPNACGVINPKQYDCNYPYEDLAGVGVAFKLVSALFKDRDLNLKEELKDYLPLVSLGTIADVVPLQNENRTIVKKGLDLLNHSKYKNNFNLDKLVEVSKLKNIKAGSIGYILAPMINAAGRLGQVDVAIDFLTKNEDVSKKAKHLKELNEERKRISENIYDEACAYIEKNIDLDNEKVLLIPIEDAHKGVIGNVAGDLCQDFYRPTVLFSVENNKAIGSARSIPSFNIHQAFKENENLFTSFGGHKQAAGCSLKLEDLEKLRENINEYADEVLEEQDLQAKVKVDKTLKIENLDIKLFEDLEMLAPFGFGNPKPKFKLEDLKVDNFKLIGKDNKHIKVEFRQEDNTITALGWGKNDLRKQFLKKVDDINVVFKLAINEFRGNRNVQIILEDVKIPESSFVDRLFAKKNEILSKEKYRGIEDANGFNTKIVGVGEIDGELIKCRITSKTRQENIKEVEDGEVLRLFRDSNNPYDENAILLLKVKGEVSDKKVEKMIYSDEVYPESKVIEVGFLNRKIAKRIASFIDEGRVYTPIVSQVTGEDKDLLGVNIRFERETNLLEEISPKEAKFRKKLNLMPEIDVIETIRKNIIGEYEYRDKQIEVLDSLREGINTLSIFGTGRGKSACFQTIASLKAIKDNKSTIILYPLRSLVNDQYRIFKKKTSGMGLKVHKGNGSISYGRRKQLFNDLKENDLDILLTTPEFIQYHYKKFKKFKEDIGFLVVDEAHHIGYARESFRSAYKDLDKIKKFLNDPLTLATTATANAETSEIIKDKLEISSIIVDDYIRKNLNIVDKRKIGDENVKMQYLDNLIKEKPNEKTIVFTNSIPRTIEIAEDLRKTNPSIKDKIAFYNSEMTNEERNGVEERFQKGEIKFIVSTSAFSEGVNIPDIKNIVLYHMNFNFKDFNQLSGRAGRNGEKAYIHLLYNHNDARVNEFILENSTPSRKELQKYYLLFKKLSNKNENNEFKFKPKELAESINSCTEEKLFSAIEIFKELDIIELLDEVEQRYYFNEEIKKVKLEKSLRYIEGNNDKKAFEEFKKFALNAEKNSLLKKINRPIYPEKKIDIS